MSPPEVKIISTAEDFARIASRWDEMVSISGNPSPFISHSWLSAWWDHFREDNRIYIFTVWTSDNLRGIIPLMRSRFSIQRIFKFDCLRSLTNPHSPEFDVICRTEDIKTVIGTLKQHLNEHPEIWELLLLERIRAGSETPRILEEFFRSGATRINTKPWEGSYYIPIKGEFREYFAGLNKSFRKNIRNRNNKLAALGTPDFRVLGEYDPAAVETFYRLENTGWKRENRSSIALRPREVKFYQEIASRFARKGEFSLTFLSTGEEQLASIFGLVRGKIFYFLKLGVNYSCPECDKLSPGQAILYRLIQYCFEKKLTGFDFCGPFTPYESQWTKSERRKQQVTIYNLRRSRVKLYLALKAILSPLYRRARRGQHTE